METLPVMRQRQRFRDRTQISLAVVIFTAAFLCASNWFRIHTNPYHDDFLSPEIRGGLAAGRDFYANVQSATAIVHGGLSAIPYPPLSVLAHLPWSIAAQPSYLTFSVLLILALLLTTFLCLRENDELHLAFAGAISIALAAALYHSYWFQFELERGNSDVIATLFSAAGLFTLRRRNGIPSLIFFAMATQWRVYPAFLGLLLIPRYGFLRAVQFAALNAVLFLVAGIAELKAFIANAAVLFGAYGWIAPSHSLRTYMHEAGLPDYFPLAVSLAVLAALFTLAVQWWVYRTRDDRDASRNQPINLAETGIAGLLFGLMVLIPSVSIDFKLGIHLVPLLLLATRSVPRDSLFRWILPAATAVIAATFGYLSSPGCTYRIQAILVLFFTYLAFTITALLLDASGFFEIKIDVEIKRRTLKRNLAA